MSDTPDSLQEMADRLETFGAVPSMREEAADALRRAADLLAASGSTRPALEEIIPYNLRCAASRLVSEARSICEAADVLDESRKEVMPHQRPDDGCPRGKPPATARPDMTLPPASEPEAPTLAAARREGAEDMRRRALAAVKAGKETLLRCAVALLTTAYTGGYLDAVEHATAAILALPLTEETADAD